MADATLEDGDSAEQRNAEPEFLAAAAAALGLSLEGKRLPTGTGTFAEIFGMSDEPLVLCEACVHQGPLKGGQKRKLMADAFKLLYAERLLGRPARKVLLLAGEEAAAYFKRRSWSADAFRLLEIETVHVPLRPEVRERIRQAQTRQSR